MRLSHASAWALNALIIYKLYYMPILTERRPQGGDENEKERVKDKYPLFDVPLTREGRFEILHDID